MFKFLSETSIYKVMLLTSSLLISNQYFNPALGSINRQFPKVTISANNIPLGKVFKKIERQTGLRIDNNFVETHLNEKRTVTVNFIRADIKEVMIFLLSDKDNLAYKINHSTISIFKQSNALTELSNNIYKTDTIPNKVQFSGKIVDKDGNPIPGVSIKLKDNKRGTISNSEGRFNLSGISKGTPIILTSLGFESKEIKADNSNILVELHSHTNLIDEKIIIAYGSTTKRLNTGNISSIKAKDIETQPINNPMLALQGRVPGLYVEQATGLPGTGVTVRIQGNNSLFKGNDPFYVVDGVPYISQLLPINNTIGGTSGAPGISGNPLNYLNTSDIESIEILKDADATAIYGSRAANGAVLITTKKGKMGPTKANVLLQSGWAKVAKKLDVLKTKEYLSMRHEALSNDGIPISQYDWDLNGTWDTTRNVDWQKELIGHTAQYTDAQFDVSGGNTLTQFLFGAAYHKETTVFPGNFSDAKGSIHLNLNNNSFNQKFRIAFSGSYMFDDNKLPRNDLTQRALTLVPVAPDPYTSDGSINWAPDSSGASTYFGNPIAPITYKSINKTYNLISNAIISYEIIPNLIIKSSFGYNNLLTNETTLSPLSINSPEYRLYARNSTVFLTNRMSSWSIEPQLEYRRKLGNGNVTALLGSTLSQQNSDQQRILASGFNNELVMQDLTAAAKITGSNINSIYKYNALYGRVTYNLADKYIINFTGRRDGSSRFGPQSQLHNFGAVGIAWVFSQETLLQKKLPFLSFGKIRGSFGTSGNDQIGDYQFLDVYKSFLTTGTPYQNAIGLKPIQLTNPYLQWEQTRKLQFGLELGFIKNRILFTTNYNRNRSSNQLVSAPLSTVTGSTGVTMNFPAIIQNTGWEFTITTSNIRTNNFNWSTNLNLTIPKNQLLSYFGQDKNNSIFIGQPLSVGQYFNYVGVNDTTGKYQFKDSKGNLTYTPSDPVDKTVIANLERKYYGGIQNSLSYKGLSLDIFIQFTKKPGIDDNSFGLNRTYPGFFNSGVNNQTTSILDRWQKPGDKSAVQPYSTSNVTLNYINYSSAVLVDASFIRLKNISVSWQFPNEWKKTLHFQNARVYVNAQNIFTITKYKALDPESGYFSLPPLRVVVVGIQVTL